MLTNTHKRKTAVGWSSSGLANEAVEKASVKGDVPKVATDRSYVDILDIT